MAKDGVVFNDVVKALQKISQYIHKTPVLTCSQADKRSGRNLYFKCEFQQKTGSFKARGALYAVSPLNLAKILEIYRYSR